MRFVSNEVNLDSGKLILQNYYFFWSSLRLEFCKLITTAIYLLSFSVANL